MVEVLRLFFHHREVLPRKKVPFLPFSSCWGWWHLLRRGADGLFDKAAETMLPWLCTLECGPLATWWPQQKWHGDLDFVSPHLLFTNKRLPWTCHCKKSSLQKLPFGARAEVMRVKRYAGAPAFKLDKAWTATCVLAGHVTVETISLNSLDAATLRLLLQSSFVDGARYQRHSSWPCGWSLHLLQFGISCQGKFSFLPAYDHSVFFFYRFLVGFPGRRRCPAGSWRAWSCDHWWRLLPVGSLLSLSLWPVFQGDLRDPVTWRLKLRNPCVSPMKLKGG